MDAFKKPMHTICVDKNDYRHVKELGWNPTEHLTKDYLRKLYETNRLKNNPHN